MTEKNRADLKTGFTNLPVPITRATLNALHDDVADSATNRIDDAPDLVRSYNCGALKQTGWVDGCTVSATLAPTATTFDITAGTIYIYDPALTSPTYTGTEVSFAGVTGETPLLGSPITYLSINSSGTLVKQSTPEILRDEATMRQNAYIGYIFSDGAGNISLFGNVKTKDIQNRLGVLPKLFSVVGGSTPFALSGVSGLRQMNMAAGQVIFDGINASSGGTAQDSIQYAAVPNVTFVRIWRANGNDPSNLANWNTDATPVNTFDPSDFDDGTVSTGSNPNGTVTANSWAHHSFYIFSSDQGVVVFMQYAQDTHIDAEAAGNDALKDTRIVYPLLEDIPRTGFVLVRGGGTDWSNPNDFQFLPETQN
jgi:hypothetical protein